MSSEYKKAVSVAVGKVFSDLRDEQTALSEDSFVGTESDLERLTNALTEALDNVGRIREMLRGRRK